MQNRISYNHKWISIRFYTEILLYLMGCPSLVFNLWKREKRKRKVRNVSFGKAIGFPNKTNPCLRQ